MKKICVIMSVILTIAMAASSFRADDKNTDYDKLYASSLNEFENEAFVLLDKIKKSDLSSEQEVNAIKDEIGKARLKLKNMDFWLRYFEPLAYKRMNGPLSVEWENEVFEKYEPPYKREGAGLTLAELYLDEKEKNADSLARLIQLSVDAVATFRADSITSQLKTFDHFFLCNRLYLLNLAAIYTTGFECPDTKRIIPELRNMVAHTNDIYLAYNIEFPATALSAEYMNLYSKTIVFVSQQPDEHTQFDHFKFIREYVNPLFSMNQKMIRQYNAASISFNDFTLNNSAVSIFDKGLYAPQNAKGIFSLVDDEKVLNEIKAMGKLLFYDPILSGNGERSCASCHKPTEYFTDTSLATNLNFAQQGSLARNTPTLINVIYNHLLMLDGKHISLQAQGKDVMTNLEEMGSGNADEIVAKVLSCKEYKHAFKKFAKLTHEAKEVSIDHIISAVTLYYSDFSSYYSPFDEAMDKGTQLDGAAIKGFNIFMSKAQCATCHFIPQFNGVAPPYITSEFEVLGVPGDKAFGKLSEDKGRYKVNPAFETTHAFRTGTVRNAEYTKPYMHNGVFRTLEEVIDFYDAGGGVGRKLDILNQTLAADSLKLTVLEKKELISFIHSLNEHISFPTAPAALPISSNKALNTRKVGGAY